MYSDPAEYWEPVHCPQSHLWHRLQRQFCVRAGLALHKCTIITAMEKHSPAAVPCTQWYSSFCSSPTTLMCTKHRHIDLFFKSAYLQNFINDLGITVEGSLQGNKKKEAAWVCLFVYQWTWDKQMHSSNICLPTVLQMPWKSINNKRLKSPIRRAVYSTKPVVF